MIQEKEYLKAKLREAGVKSQIYTTMKELKTSNEVHLGAVLREGESFVRSGSKKTFEDKEGVRKRRKKLYDRTTKVKVVIGDSSEDGCEVILTKFLSVIGSGMEIDGNWSSIEIGDIEWVDEKDSLIRSKMAVEFILTFSGGLYQDIVLKGTEINNISTD